MVSYSLFKALFVAFVITCAQGLAIPPEDKIQNREQNANPVASISERSDQSPNPLEETKRNLQKRTNTCGSSTFVNRTSSNSPSYAHCLLLQDQQTRFPQTYTVNKSTNWIHLVRFGDCAFGVKNSGSYPGYVGNEDIADVMRDAIAKFTSNGKIGADGSMPCSSSNPIGTVFIQWSFRRV